MRPRPQLGPRSAPGLSGLSLRPNLEGIQPSGCRLQNRPFGLPSFGTRSARPGGGMAEIDDVSALLFAADQGFDVVGPLDQRGPDLGQPIETIVDSADGDRAGDGPVAEDAADGTF